MPPPPSPESPSAHNPYAAPAAARATTPRRAIIVVAPSTLLAVWDLLAVAIGFATPAHVLAKRAVIGTLWAVCAILVYRRRRAGVIAAAAAAVTLADNLYAVIYRWRGLPTAGIVGAIIWANTIPFAIVTYLLVARGWYRRESEPE